MSILRRSEVIEWVRAHGSDDAKTSEIIEWVNDVADQLTQERARRAEHPAPGPGMTEAEARYLRYRLDDARKAEARMSHQRAGQSPFDGLMEHQVALMMNLVDQLVQAVAGDGPMSD